VEHLAAACERVTLEAASRLIPVPRDPCLITATMSRPPDEKRGPGSEPAPTPSLPGPTIVLGVSEARSGELEMEFASGIVVESVSPAQPAKDTVVLAEPNAGRARLASPPRDFGKYELIDEIGRGGMGVVYKARHKELDRVVAIKMILASHLASPEQVERFYAEARAAARIVSPQIVGIHDVGQIHGQHYFAMDYVPGPSLAQLLHDGPLAPTDAARYVLAVARAVAHLHAQGIVHRDLKPSNVLLDESGRPRVTDFGLAKMLQAEGRMTRTGAIVGTPGYMAPEQAAGKAGEVGPLSDVYSLGAILYELLTGRPPFSGETPLDTLVQVLEGEPPRPSRLRPGLPRAIEQICMRCLERSPHDRYVSASALADDLDHFLRGEQIEARRQGAWQNLRRWARREPALVSRLGTMGICGAIIQANHYLIQNTEPPSQRRAIAVVVIWALASLAFQALLNRERWAGLARYAWAAADVILYTLLVQINDGLSTSLVAGYFLLVAASGLWFREHLVWVTTAMAVAAYGALAVNAGLFRTVQVESPYRHVVFVAALAVSGLITGYQVKRVRALSQYYETRPLP
jgi:tRNA A-37 threonylcarbamoyl transferase component Bud32